MSADTEHSSTGTLNSRSLLGCLHMELMKLCRAQERFGVQSGNCIKTVLLGNSNMDNKDRLFSSRLSMWKCYGNTLC